MSTEMTPEQRGIVIEGYKQLADLLRHEEALFWKRTETFLVISAGLIGILGLFWPSETQAALSASMGPPPSFFGFVICAVGVIMCLFWLVVVRRSEAFYNHWYEQLKFLEKQYLAPLSVFQTADQFFAEGHVKLGDAEFKLDPVSRLGRVYQVMIGAPLVFLVAWLTILCSLIFVG
jgi:hypothetical protein